LKIIKIEGSYVVSILTKLDQTALLMSILLECPEKRDIYTVNHKKGGSTFVIITLENLDGF